MFLTILIIITCICVSGLFISLYNDNDDGKGIFTILIVVVLFVGWFCCGLLLTTSSETKTIPNKNIVLLIGKNNVIMEITDEPDVAKDIIIFDDIKTYKLLSDTTKKKYIRTIEYNLYGLENERTYSIINSK